MAWAAWVTAALGGQMGQGSTRLSACKVQKDDFFFLRGKKKAHHKELVKKQ